jgi:hypothetical protein
MSPLFREKSVACRRDSPGLLIHDLRRSAVRNMEQACVPRSVAMKLTGHKTENVYPRYAIVSEADLDSAAVRLAEADVTFYVAFDGLGLKYCSPTSRLHWLRGPDMPNATRPGTPIGSTSNRRP